MSPVNRITRDDSGVYNDFTLKSACMECRLLTDVLGRTCVAFPEGIPADIQNGTNKHDAPVEGDDGFTFSSIRRGE